MERRGSKSGKGTLCGGGLVALTMIAMAACTSPTTRDSAQEPRSTQEQAGRGARPDATSCEGLPTAADLKRLLQEAPAKSAAGGLMGGRMQWASVVNRAGEVCATAVATDDPSAAWPGSQAIAKAKAFTANAFSTDDAPLSTARLYTLSQPGQSLWGIANGNGFNPECLVLPGDADATDGKLCGGTIAFGGGLPLYRDGRRAGGLGVSGDTACADHETAKTMRDLAGLNPPKGRGADDIVYAERDGPSVFAHPLCPNTMRDGEKIGDPQPAGTPGT
jgi:uncharacterized protein GlcG (DUF336 family)